MWKLQRALDRMVSFISINYSQKQTKKISLLQDDVEVWEFGGGLPIMLTMFCLSEGTEKERS